MPGWGDVVTNLDTVPVVALALGPTAGLGAARTVASHYSIMVRGLSQLFAAGPAVVDGLGESYKGAADQQQAKEELGGVDIHTRNGVVDDEVASEAEAFARARHFLSFMPEYVGQSARRSACDDPADRREEALLSLVPRDPKQVYSMRRALEMILDSGTVFEIGKHWGRAAITALARLDGWPVAVVASDPSYLGGSWEAKTSEKVERFVNWPTSSGCRSSIWWTTPAS